MQACDENADPFTRTVYVTIARLKRKLGEPPLIQTSPGLGYKSPRLNDVRLRLSRA
jgi:DNA-binding response OmpR family regulator